MKKLLALLLAVSILLCCAASAFAAENEIDYKDLFAQSPGYQTFHNLLNALLRDPRRFIKELAFCDADTQSQVQNCLSYTTYMEEEYSAVYYLFRDIQLRQPYGSLTKSESALIDALLYSYSAGQIYYYMSEDALTELFQDIVNADTSAGQEDLAYQLAGAMVASGTTFLDCFLNESPAVQDAILRLLEIYNHSYVGTKLVESMQKLRSYIANSYAGDPTEYYALIDRILSVLNAVPDPIHFVGPDSEELAQWNAEGYDTPSPKNYGNLFTAVLQGEALQELNDAALYDTGNFILALSALESDDRLLILDAMLQDPISPEHAYVTLLAVEADASRTNFGNSDEKAITYNTVSSAYYELAYEIKSFPSIISDIMNYRYHTLRDITGELMRYACFAPFEFIRALAAAPENTVPMLSSIMTNNADSDMRQDFVNVLYYVKLTAEQTDSEDEKYLSAEELAVLDAILTAQSEGSVPVYPQGVGPEISPDEPIITIDPTFVYSATIIPIPVASSDTQTASASASSTEGSQNRPDWLMIFCFCIAAAAIVFGLVQQRKAKKKVATPVIVEQPAAVYPAPLEEDQKAQITVALKKHYGEYHIDWYHQSNPQGTARCYGSENGYDILFYAGGFRLGIPGSITVAGKTFYYDTAFELLVHQDGNLTGLQQAFADGLISQDAIVSAYKLHEQCD